eukprot:4954477-Prymnesium_polylepis.1
MVQPCQRHGTWPACGACGGPRAVIFILQFDLVRQQQRGERDIICVLYGGVSSASTVNTDCECTPCCGWGLRGTTQRRTSQALAFASVYCSCSAAVVVVRGGGRPALTVYCTPAGAVGGDTRGVDFLETHFTRVTTAWGDSAARGNHGTMRHLSPACMESEKNTEIVARPWSAYIMCSAIGGQSTNKTPPRGHHSGGDAPSDPTSPPTAP